MLPQTCLSKSLFLNNPSTLQTDRHNHHKSILSHQPLLKVKEKVQKKFLFLILICFVFFFFEDGEQDNEEELRNRLEMAIRSGDAVAAALAAQELARCQRKGKKSVSPML
jgi:hypothetical protein